MLVGAACTGCSGCEVRTVFGEMCNSAPSHAETMTGVKEPRASGSRRVPLPGPQ